VYVLVDGELGGITGMAKLSLPSFVGTPGATQLNTWKSLIEAFAEDTVSLTGVLPNSMTTDLDLDSNDILNVNLIAVQDIAYRGEPIEGLLTAATAQADRAESEADAAALSASAALASELAAQDAANSIVGFYNTLAELKAETNIVIGDVVQTYGYATAGDGGGAVYEIVAAGTGSGARYETLTGSGLQAKEIQKEDVIPAAATFTVGAGGDFATMNECFAYLSRTRKIYESTATTPQGALVSGFFVEVRLLSGFVMQEQVLLNGTDLGWIRLVSDDAEVTISRQHLTTMIFDRYPAFAANDNSTLPVISVLFNMDATGLATEREGFFINNCSSAKFDFGAGCKNAGSRGLHVANSSFVVARECNFSGAGTFGVRVANAATCHFRQSVATGCGEGGLVVSDARVNAYLANFSGSLGYGMLILESRVMANEVNVSGCALDNVYARRGSHVSIGSCNADNAGGMGLRVDHGTVVDASYGSFKNAGGADAIAVTDGCTVDLFAADLTGAAGNGIVAARGSIVNAQSAVLVNVLGAFACLAVDGATINATSANATGATGTFDINRGSFINAATITGTLGRAANTITNRGIIFQ
jgi:hypothetical protein